MSKFIRGLRSRSTHVHLLSMSPTISHFVQSTQESNNHRLSRSTQGIRQTPLYRSLFIHRTLRIRPLGGQRLNRRPLSNLSQPLETLPRGSPTRLRPDTIPNYDVSYLVDPPHYRRIRKLSSALLRSAPLTVLQVDSSRARQRHLLAGT
jgi:hypothetical protein